MSHIPTHYEVSEQLVGETDAWLIRVAKEFADGQGVFRDYVDGAEIAANMDREQRRRFEATNF